MKTNRKRREGGGARTEQGGSESERRSEDRRPRHLVSVDTLVMTVGVRQALQMVQFCVRASTV